VQSLLSEGEVGDGDGYRVTGAKVKDTITGKVIDIKARQVTHTHTHTHAHAHTLTHTHTHTHTHTRTQGDQRVWCVLR
jgi:ABC-type Zn2+ transport system substrate-binding protein/surface adhesin